jgi:poly-gamma-glutamate synthesis protein (capsule biosynthesis protein)
MLGRLLWHADGRLEAGLIPVHVEPPGRPVIADAQQALRIRDYVAVITRAAGLPPARLTPRADMLVVQ